MKKKKYNLHIILKWIENSEHIYKKKVRDWVKVILSSFMCIKEQTRIYIKK